jgi:hypothetical protein
LTPTSAYSWTNSIVAHPIMYPNFSLIRLTFFQLVESWINNPLILVIDRIKSLLIIRFGPVSNILPENFC